MLVMVVDLRRELNHINKQIRTHGRTAGESVVWYEFAAFDYGSTYDPVYDESPQGPLGIAYKPGVVIPTIYVEEIEDTNRAIEMGRQPVQKVHFSALMLDVVRAGLTEPWEYQPHLNDLFLYDGRFYHITYYRARGRLRDEVLLVVEGQETYIDQEHVNDILTNQVPSIQDLPWPSNLPAH